MIPTKTVIDHFVTHRNHSYKLFKSRIIIPPFKTYHNCISSFYLWEKPQPILKNQYKINYNRDLKNKEKEVNDLIKKEILSPSICG